MRVSFLPFNNTYVVDNAADTVTGNTLANVVTGNSAAKPVCGPRPRIAGALTGTR